MNLGSHVSNQLDGTMDSASLRVKCSTLGFTDLAGFRDYVGFVRLCAPDMFPHDDWLAPEEQLNLESAFVGLRDGLELTEHQIGDSSVIVQFRNLVEQAYIAFRSGADLEGHAKLEECDKLILRIRSS